LKNPEIWVSKQEGFLVIRAKEFGSRRRRIRCLIFLWSIENRKKMKPVSLFLL